MVKKAEDYPYSSARAHLTGKDDSLVKVKPMLKIIEDWGAYLGGKTDEEEIDLLRRHERSGRPLGSRRFIKRIEQKLGMIVQKLKPGPKKRRK